MNDLGLTLAWLAVQVTLVLVPALSLYALAARRSPAAGAWVAALSLGLVVMLSASALLPGIRRGRRAGNEQPAATSRPAVAATPAGASSETRHDTSRPPTDRNRSFAGWRAAWARFERGAAEPAARCRPWGGVLAAVALAGTATGLLRLVLGLGAVVACRRRGRAVDDPEMTGLLGELRGAVGCRAPVELREVPDLVGPATAGWRRPVVLLPDDWRSWDESERRAVLAHELAHVVRGDYAAGLLARLAVALNSYHPLVLWTAGQLRLQQELAADALGARHAGGSEAYLVALSRLALRQDERSPCWPARAFLPARGTLIRRIAMLSDPNRTGTFDRPWTAARRLSAALFLLGVTAAVATLRGPARGSVDGAPAAKAAAPDAGPSIPPLYLRDGMNGVIVLRPAAASRHAGMDRLVRLLVQENPLGIDLSSLAKELKVDTSRPGFLKLGVEDLDWVTFGLGFGRGKNSERTDLHAFMLSVPVVRTVAPFDWLAYLRQWRFEFAEAREGGRPYYRVLGPWKEILGPDPCVYLPDDRTLIVDSEAAIRKLARGEAPASCADLLVADWARACRSLFAVAILNENGSFAKSYDLSRPDDAAVLSLFKGVDRWIFSVDDAEPLALRASAACRDADAGRAVALTIDSLLKLATGALEHPDPADLAVDANARADRMCKALLAGLRVRRSDRSVDVRAEGFGTLADLASIVEGDVGEAKPTGRDGGGDSKGPKR
jgi:beta-lactamase regulating signal transducer with metallopeptidase domain